MLSRLKHLLQKPSLLISMTFEAYKNSFFKIDRFKCDRTLLKRPDYNLAKKGIDATVPFVGE